MLFKTFTLPASSAQLAENELNVFLKTNKIISVQKEFVQEPPCWCFLIEYISDENTTTKQKVDYMKILSQEEFSLFAKLRELRKKIASEEKIPAYAVFTDEQLSAIVKRRPENISSLQGISSIGHSKAEKYGEKFIALIKPDEQPDIF